MLAPLQHNVGLSIHHVLEVRQALAQRHILRHAVVGEHQLDVIGAPLRRLSELTIGISRPPETIWQAERFVETQIQLFAERVFALGGLTEEVQADTCEENDCALFVIRDDAAPEELADKASSQLLVKRQLAKRLHGEVVLATRFELEWSKYHLRTHLRLGVVAGPCRIKLWRRRYATSDRTRPSRSRSSAMRYQNQHTDR